MVYVREERDQGRVLVGACEAGLHVQAPGVHHGGLHCYLSALFLSANLRRNKTRIRKGPLLSLFTFGNRNHITVGEVQARCDNPLRVPVRLGAINGVSNKPPRPGLPTSFPRFFVLSMPARRISTGCIWMPRRMPCEAVFASLDGHVK